MTPLRRSPFACGLRPALAGAVLAWAFWLLLAPSSRATPPPDHLPVFSRSEQFVVSGPRQTPAGRRGLSPSTRDNTVVLAPEPLAVSCERIKDDLLQALSLRDEWRANGRQTGRIHVHIDPRRPTNSPPAVQAIPFEHGWKFHVSLPQVGPEDVVVRALVQALLMELGGRRGNARAPEVPLWMVEGVTQTILAGSPSGAILRPESQTVSVFRFGEHLAGVRNSLARRPPLSFHELSQPDLTRMEPEDWQHYSACAHLLFRELCRVPQGQRRLAQWILRLQENWNWQSGFLDSFHPDFRSLLDVEKWWALALADFIGRSPTRAWPASFALSKLDDALRPASILPGSTQPSRLTLEEVITTWDFPLQIPVLQRFITQMRALWMQSPPEVAPLVLQYADAVDEYLSARARAGYSALGRGHEVTSVRLVTRSIISRLRELDGRRSELAAAAASNSSPPATGPVP